MEKIKIACGQGFWGDWPEAPVNLVRQGQLDYLILDYLAEVTMSILAKQKENNPELGYARDFVQLIEKIAADISEKNIKVISNAGGLNPVSCAKAIFEVLKKKNLHQKIRVAAISGDDITSRLPDLLEQGESFSNLDTREAFSKVRDRVKTANAYIGARPVAAALTMGADIVVCGRVADPAMVLAPMLERFKWADNDWNKLAAGIVAGHIIECGAQCTGGNFSLDWSKVPDLANVGYPIVEVSADGTFVVTKHENTGGIVSAASVKEQLVYEIGNPKHYITPDVVVDFTSLKLKEIAKNKVAVSDVKGQKRPEKLKVSVSYFAGYMTSGTMVYTWPNAVKKAEAAAEIVKQRLRNLELSFEKICVELIGYNSCYPAVSIDAVPTGAEAPEVMLRMAVSSQNRKAVERFSREMVPLVLNGPPGGTGYAGAKGEVKEIFAYWPTLVSRDFISAEVQLIK